MSMTECPRCGSREIVPRLPLSGDEGATVTVNVDQNPDAIFLKGNLHRASLLATVCGACGLVELEVDTPRELAEAWRETRPETEEEARRDEQRGRVSLADGRSPAGRLSQTDDDSTED